MAQNNIDLLRLAHQLLEASHPMNLRQLHYAIFSSRQGKKIGYQNTKSEYVRLSGVTSHSRRRHRQAELRGYGHIAIRTEIPHEWMVDELRGAEMVSVWDNAAEYIGTLRRDYRRDLWQDQPVYVEVWCEKAAILGSLRPVTEELGVRLRPCRGFASAGMEGEIGNLFEDINKPIHVFYLGDFDPSGDIIDRDIYRRAQIAAGKDFTMTRLAIFQEDIKGFDLPPQPIKENDLRSKSFKKKYGKKAQTVEVDALPVGELRRRVHNAIVELIDLARWDWQTQKQEKEFKSISDLAAQWRTLPPAGTTEAS